jgi:SNF2 family DNA or RNA helicase
MFKITDKMIKDIATNSQVYYRGISYFNDNRVVNVEFDRYSLELSADVLGSYQYNVNIQFSETGEIAEMHCDCPAFYEYNGACKHIVALLKVFQHFGEFETEVVESKTEITENILNYFQYHLNSQEKKNINLEITYELSEMRNFTREIIPSLSLRMGEDKLYVVKNIKKILEAREEGEELYFGKNFSYNPFSHEFNSTDKSLINLIDEIYEVEKNINDNWRYQHNSMFKGKQLFLTQSAAKRVLSLLQGKSFNLLLFGREYRDVNIVKEDLPLELFVEKDKEEILLKWKSRNLIPLVETGEFIFLEGKIYKLSDYQNKFIIPIIIALTQCPDGVSFSKKQQENFVTKILPVTKKIASVTVSQEVNESLLEADLKTNIYFDRDGDAVTAQVDFIYDVITINPFDKAFENKSDKILVRDFEIENKVLNFFEKAEFKTLNGKFYLEDDNKIYEFIYEILPELQKWADVFYSEAFRNININRTFSFAGGVSLNQESEMLEFSFELDGIDSSELKDIFKSMSEKKKYYRLKDGSFLPLEEDNTQLQHIMEMVNNLQIKDKDLQKKIVEIPKNRALYVDQCLKELESHRIKRNLEYEKLVQNIQDPQDLDFEVPKNLEKVLRDYQQTGYKWMKTLAMYGFGGILADDMGLGKTLQTIAFILSEKEKIKKAALVVAPTSVIYNWQDEVNRFAPNLKIVVITGTPQERNKMINEAQSADMVVTSYPLIRRDYKKYKDIEFSFCFLDEAQHIKNPNSLSAKAVKTIKAKNYFALTGTPLENNLTELWSIFDFVMEGYLLNHNKFQNKYEKQIAKNNDKKALKELQKQITPFVMRRMKKDVLKELPPKFESKSLTELTKEQKKIYLAYLQKIKGEIDQEISEKGFEKSRIKILAALTRLRQICCHPAMFLNNYSGSSGKLLYLQDVVKDSVESGHRILLFSQFTSMLKIIREHLNKEKINYFYLDGSTKKENRTEMVKDYNKGNKEVFLISLKAGGTGLNLTGADMVIHYDPWWNPAVEEQATDRAYRIGQENAVQVIKLITKGTIEEKIYEMQQKKKSMIDSVIKPGETMLSKMTEKEIKELFKGQD